MTLYYVSYHQEHDELKEMGIRVIASDAKGCLIEASSWGAVSDFMDMTDAAEADVAQPGRYTDYAGLMYDLNEDGDVRVLCPSCGEGQEVRT